jgi:hypothetical protein
MNPQITGSQSNLQVDYTIWGLCYFILFEMGSVAPISASTGAHIGAQVMLKK